MYSCLGCLFSNRKPFSELANGNLNCLITDVQQYITIWMRLLKKNKKLNEYQEKKTKQ